MAPTTNATLAVNMASEYGTNMLARFGQHGLSTVSSALVVVVAGGGGVAGGLGQGVGGSNIGSMSMSLPS